MTTTETRTTRFPSCAPIAELEALGFTFGPVLDGDRLFRTATLPAGWRREGDEYATWSYLLDEKGRQRVAIFYKGAFYGRDAFASIIRPTSRLTRQIWSEEDPGPVELDDLLSADEAREYLTAELESARRYARTNPDFYDPQVKRIEALLATLPGSTT